MQFVTRKNARKFSHKTVGTIIKFKHIKIFVFQSIFYQIHRNLRLKLYMFNFFHDRHKNSYSMYFIVQQTIKS